MAGTGNSHTHRGGQESGDGIPGSSDNCELVEIETTLISPVVERIAELKLGDVLRLCIVAIGNHDTVVALTKGGDQVGSITSGQLGRLLRCMANGNEYLADVLKIEGAECRVRVHHQNR